MRKIVAVALLSFLAAGLLSAQDANRSEAEKKALTTIRQAGGLALELAQNDPRIEVSYQQITGKLTPALLAVLKDIKGLVHLNLRGLDVTDSDLAQLKDLTTLTRLHLEKTKITDKGLTHLKGLVNLEYLNLYGTEVTDAGLAQLEGLKKLKNVYLWQTKVSDAGVARMKKALPQVEITRGLELAKLPEEKKEEKRPAKKDDKKDAPKKEEKKDAPKKEEKKAADKPLNEKVKEIAGTAEFLRSVPKHFAALQAVDVPRRRVTLLVEGESLAKVWPLVADAEIKVAGWWGRLDQLRPGDRVWVWFKTDRAKHPVAVSMLADELSEQDIHGTAVLIEARDAATVTLKPAKGKSRAVKTDKAEVFRGNEKAVADTVKAGEKVYAQTVGDAARLLLDSAAFEARRAAQKVALRQRWIDEGLPGTVTFLHIFGGEMDYMLDHEAMRWGRSLKTGDKVTLQATPPINALVRQVTPWRERTQLRLVVNGADQADLAIGQRITLKMTPPPPEVDTARLPPDLGRPRSRPERIDWFLASIYCACGVAGDICTGHFYTLASCNVNGCGMPNHMRNVLGEHIDKGLNDAQIFEALVKEFGPDLLRPHLKP